VAYLSDHFSMIKPSDLKKVSKTNTKEIFCLISFDDGLREQYEYAIPVLQKHHVDGLFFVNGINTAKSVVSDVHKIHYLRSITEPTKFSGQLSARIDQLGIDLPLHREEFLAPEGQSQYDDVDVQYTKYLFSHVLTESQKKQVVKAMYEDQQFDEGVHSQQLYMTTGMLIELAKQQCLGSHGWTHDVKTLENLTVTLNDFNRNQQFFQETLGARVDCISYPYGGKNAVSPDVALMACSLCH
jgi:peptidoglycan/xylan/chitin deacetylase (PgdA/CDA1 family)